jgi:hypothetical protein
LLLTALSLHCRRLSLPSAGLLHLLGEGGVAVPPPHHLLLVDPRLLAWLLEPQLLQVGGRPARAGRPNSCRLLFERSSHTGRTGHFWDSNGSVCLSCCFLF